MQKPLFNLHTHSHYCDGSSPPEAYVEAAITKGFHTLGFSSHAPVPFDNKFAIHDEESLLRYAEEINALKEKYRDQIHIFLALEVDFIPGVTSTFAYFRERIQADYLIGGVHLIKKPEAPELWFIDGPMQATYDEGLKKLYGTHIKEGVTRYWEQVREMLLTEKPDIVAHLDKIKMHNQGRFFNENEAWYIDQVEQTLAVIARQNTIVEINTRGLYKGRSEETFPGAWLLRKINEMNIPITLNSDAHKPEELDGFYTETKAMMREIGFSSIKNFTDHGWEDVAY